MIRARQEGRSEEEILANVQAAHERDLRLVLVLAAGFCTGLAFLTKPEPFVAALAGSLAAMGGMPQYALITVAVRREETVERLQRLYAGLERAGRREGRGDRAVG